MVVLINIGCETEYVVRKMRKEWFAKWYTNLHFCLLKFRGMNYMLKSQWGPGSALNMMVCYVNHQCLIFPMA